MGLIDFDKSYSDFVRQWAKENAARLKGDIEPDAFAGEIYEQWLNRPLPEAGDLSPKEYFGGLSPDRAANILLEYKKAGMDIPSPLIDRLAENDCQGCLEKLLDDADEEVFTIAVNLLEEGGSSAHIGKMMEKLLGQESSEDIKGLAAEVLSAHAGEVKEQLLSRSGESIETDMLIADVLVYCKGDDRIYDMLVRLFESGKNNPLYAGYLGMYEDERALPLLKKRIASPEVGYIEFLELRNAIERLGGDPIEDKDFEFDPDYRALKNIK